MRVTGAYFTSPSDAIRRVPCGVPYGKQQSGLAGAEEWFAELLRSQVDVAGFGINDPVRPNLRHSRLRRGLRILPRSLPLSGRRWYLIADPAHQHGHPYQMPRRCQWERCDVLGLTPVRCPLPLPRHSCPSAICNHKHRRLRMIEDSYAILAGFAVTFRKRRYTEHEAPFR